MSNIFITGGAGYVGSMLVPKLLKLDHKVTVFDLMIYGDKVLDDHKNLKKITGDIRNQNLSRQTLKDHDVVIHLACISNDPSYELNPTLGKSINFDAFEPLVKISRESDVQKFIYASSSSVYGIKKDREENFFLKFSRNIYYNLVTKISNVNIPPYVGEFNY